MISGQACACHLVNAHRGFQQEASLKKCHLSCLIDKILDNNYRDVYAESAGGRFAQKSGWTVITYSQANRVSDEKGIYKDVSESALTITFCPLTGLSTHVI